jgi:hypothetical protein
MDNPVAFAVVFVMVGLLVGAALALIVYTVGRKATADELDERGFVGRKR